MDSMKDTIFELKVLILIQERLSQDQDKFNRMIDPTGSAIIVMSWSTLQTFDIMPRQHHHGNLTQTD